ncbi:MAG: hypothetical protein KF812_11510 [Fimbriimonadaceae bacterium]|nr:hypothetical protein [Fimbriimonadaceae bacterium]
MNDGVTLDFAIDFRTGRNGRRELRERVDAAPTEVPPGRVPRLSRLMALAIRFDDLVRSGAVGDFSELASLSHVTRARVSQIVNLLNLAPDIQEEILFLPLVQGDRDAISEREVRAIACESSWKAQRRMWHELSSQRVAAPRSPRGEGGK